MSSLAGTFTPKGSRKFATVLVMHDVVDAWPAVFSAEELQMLERESPGITDRRVIPGSMKVCSREISTSFAFEPLAQYRVIEKALGPSWEVVDYRPKKGDFDLELTLRSPQGTISNVETSADWDGLAHTVWYFEDEEAARRVFEFLQSKTDEILEHRYMLYRSCTWFTKLNAAVKKPNRPSPKI